MQLKDIKHVLPAIMGGSAVGAGLAMMHAIECYVPPWRDDCCRGYEKATIIYTGYGNRRRCYSIASNAAETESRE